MAHRIDDNGCWLWTVGKNRDGYGLTRSGGGSRLAHRVSWEQHNGPIPVGMKVLHKCDVPACINPDHLFLGTQADNMRDMFAKGRGQPVVAPDNAGQSNPMAKLTSADVAEIKSLAGTMTQREIGKRLGVGQDQISRIISGARWSSGT